MREIDGGSTYEEMEDTPTVSTEKSPQASRSISSACPHPPLGSRSVSVASLVTVPCDLTISRRNRNLRHNLKD
ncbi:hypothetical protein BS47DRAFT_1338663 [Hydnum rufescens UP504]|uniref:Uncharacterized protein n=1 Tax=Hydnum rufescens UP504 TaxID=1448309 RepID=A0A9P6B693_9AGAM|nr:hypothetical protein BS47DRAFT_1338663 [Hydnum rufescens UP504]